MTSQVERILMCKVCGNGYNNPDALEYHFRKEHIKTDFIAYLKRDALR